jgi:hypothetical protein
MCCYKNSQPCSCGGTCNNCQKTSSDTVQYIGPNLPITGINFNDTFTVVVQKIEEAMHNMQTTTTTTSTTAAPTTTTTTTP